MSTKTHLVQWRLGLIIVVLLGSGLAVVSMIGSVQAATAPAFYRANQPADFSSNNHLNNVLRLSDAFTSYLPLVMRDWCSFVYSETYGQLEIPNWSSSPPAENHPDINLAVRSYTPTTDFLGLVDINGLTDPGAPQLVGLYACPRPPVVKAVYQVNEWSWDCNCPIGPIDDPAVTLMDLAVFPGEAIRVPDRSGSDIGNGYKALVLYASADGHRITLKYTSEDNMVAGYGLHLENVCVDPDLLALYNTLNSAGRHELPALRAGQAVGRACSDRIGVAVRDTGGFMDPRSRKDWWHGY
jgi:hypothetical protein